LRRLRKADLLMEIIFKKVQHPVNCSAMAYAISPSNAVAVAGMLAFGDKTEMYVSVARSGEVIAKWEHTYDDLASAYADFEQWMIDYVKTEKETE